MSHAIGTDRPAAASRRPARPAEAPRRALCCLCCEELTADDGHHYGYQCHACVAREHDLLLLRDRDPGHPDLAWLDASPVEIPRGRRPR